MQQVKNILKVKELNTEEWKKIIDKCRKACIPQLTFTGGEPTIRKRFGRINRLFKMVYNKAKYKWSIINKRLMQ